MNPMEFIPEIIMAAGLMVSIAAVALIGGRAGRKNSETLHRSLEMQDKRLADLTSALSARLETLQRTTFEQQSTMHKIITDQQNMIMSRISDFTLQNEAQLENIRTTMAKNLRAIQEDNNRQLEQMRQTVDEKLQKTLEDRIGQSFKLVSDQLEQVYKGLGEMQGLAAGVGDLKRVMSNVKTRGIWGEYQLSAILEQILSPEQYDVNVATKKGGRENVEFAIKLPGDGENACVYLPIDAKFPLDTYDELIKAGEEGDGARVKAAEKSLETRIKAEAKNIRDKYIEPPYTTDFAIMFLPTEGLYAEVVKLGLATAVQRDYKVNIAGPTTIGAFLNSLQMGFKTLAIQKRSAEVWRVLGEVKSEFAKFSDILESARKRISLIDSDLEKLVGTRANAINRKLRDVETIADTAGPAVLPENNNM